MAKLLEWAASESASVSAVKVDTVRYGIRGLVTTRALRAGELIFRCPLHLTMRASDALKEPFIGKALRTARAQPGSMLDDRSLVMLLLIRSRTLGAESPWAAYISSLPDEELVSSVPMNWAGYLLDDLQGTPLYQQAMKQRETLSSWFHSSVMALSQQWPNIFPAQEYK